MDDTKLRGGYHRKDAVSKFEGTRVNSREHLSINNEDSSQSYKAGSVSNSIRVRGPWLFFLFIGGILTGRVMQFFESDLQKNIELSIFIPLLIGTGGNTGSQTVATVIRALALHDVKPGLRDLPIVLAREGLTGLGVGLMLGCVGFMLALSWGMSFKIAWVVALSVPMITVWANVIGATVPLMACRYGIDPAVISSPVCTTLVDATGLSIYFLTANLILRTF
mmetsp:Transcript_6586/g.10253  ORF Transcript_6586/g.10253 Transcript_6586/m.10253 type:complete len:222 (-) Transcript_6586:1017-1682(-)